MHRAFKFRLYPTAEQASVFAQFAGATRFAYNLALEQRETFWRQYRAATGGSLNFASQGREVTQLRREVDWLGALPSGALTQALRDLDKAFANFFAGRARYPTPRRKGINDSFRIQAKQLAFRQINRRWGEVRVPKLGWVRFRQTRGIVGTAISATFSRDALGWHVAAVCDIEHEAPANDNPAVGIDRGVTISLALSNGETFSLAGLAEIEKRIRRARRILSRRKRGSARYAKQRRRLSRVTAKAARIRADWQHKSSRSIADRFGGVAMEKLRIANMTATGPGKRGLNRSILAQGWSAFATKLAYKLEERGGALIFVDPAYTSQTCSDCGVLDRQSRESQSRFVCTACGFSANADHNAAINILRRSTSAMPVEGRGCAPVEAGTCHALAA